MTKREILGNIIIYGLDADLIMLAMVTRSNYVYLLRESVQFGKTDTTQLLFFDINLFKSKLLSKICILINEKDERARMQKSIEFLQTMAWGADAKSIPPYMLGQEQTQEHRDEADVGAFFDRDDKKKTV